METTQEQEARLQRFISQFGKDIIKYDIPKLDLLARQADDIARLVKEHELLRNYFIMSLLLDGLRYRLVGVNS